MLLIRAPQWLGARHERSVVWREETCWMCLSGGDNEERLRLMSLNTEGKLKGASANRNRIGPGVEPGPVEFTKRRRPLTVHPALLLRMPLHPG